MLEKHVAAIESSLSRESRSGTKAADHGFFEVAYRMPNPIVGSGEALGVVLTCYLELRLQRWFQEGLMRLVLLYEWNLSANSTVCVYTCEVVTPQSW